MFNSHSWQSHAEYHINFKNLKATFPSDLRLSLWNDYSVEREKLMSLDLDPVGEYLSQYYSEGGRPAKNQAQILRSLILFALLFNRTDAKISLTHWAQNVLPSNIILTALTGCSCADVLPPLGSYFDFMNRLWKGSRENYSRSCLLPSGKNGKKPKAEISADGKLAEPEPQKYVTKDLVERILDGQPLSQDCQGILQDIFYLAAVLPSIKNGIIPQKNLTLSGDGTAVAVHADPYGRKATQAQNPTDSNESQQHFRHYSDPDAEWGWDSHEKHWYFGRTLYMLSFRNTDLKVELPVLMNYTSAKRHDSINFLYAIDAFGSHEFGISPANLCLDSAHDNLPTYELLEHWNINALIDINSRNGNTDGLPKDITLDKSGHPLCKAGFRMCSWGFDKNKQAQKYRCPMACGRVTQCHCSSECSKSSYGRTVYLPLHADLRFSPRIPRDSEQYQSIYKERTACERVNNRVLNDYHLLSLKIRGDDHYSFWTMIIGVCIHLDAWYKKRNLSKGMA